MGNIFSRILVGVDESEPSDVAIALGARLACEHGGDLFLCHSVNWLPLIAELETTGTLIDPKPTIDALMEHGEELLRRAAGAANTFGVEAQLRMVDGEPGDGILSVAAELRCGLIVVGTHGRRGLGRLFIGSTAEAVLRGSTIPVLTVRSGTLIAGRTRRCLETIVAGIDDSEPATAALEAVFELPPEDRARLLLYSIADVGNVIGGYYDAAIRDGVCARAQHVIDLALLAARARSVNAQGHIAGGYAGDALCAAAVKEEADLIVLGSHGRRGVRRFFLGSVAESVVQSAPVPVLVVRTGPTPTGRPQRRRNEQSAAATVRR